MPSQGNCTATYAPERCRELVDHFRDQVLDFCRKLPRFPDWEASALAADPEAHFWACLAGSLAEELFGPPSPDGIAEDLRRIESGEVKPGGVLEQLNRPDRESDRERVLSLGYALFHIREGERAAARAA